MEYQKAFFNLVHQKAIRLIKHREKAQIRIKRTEETQDRELVFVQPIEKLQTAFPRVLTRSHD